MTIHELRDKGLILFEAVVGSRAYGLATATSDTDIKGVFYLPREYFFGNKYIAQVANSSNDEVYYELGRFVELLSKSNPNILELLASTDECLLYKDPIFERFKIQEFMTREAVTTFAQYAMVQVHKAKGLNKKINNPMDKERKSLLDFCFVIEGNGSQQLKQWLVNREWKQENCGLAKIDHTKGMYALFYDLTGKFGYKGIISSVASDEVSCSSIAKEQTSSAYLFVNHEAYSSYCKTYNEYFTWVAKRNEVRFQGTVGHGQGYDAKNMMHTIRLLEQAKEILYNGELHVHRPNREELLLIKSGTYSYEELFLRSQQLFKEIQDLSLSSMLPAVPDQAMLTKLLVELREELYR